MKIKLITVFLDVLFIMTWKLINFSKGLNRIQIRIRIRVDQVPVDVFCVCTCKLYCAFVPVSCMY